MPDENAEQSEQPKESGSAPMFSKKGWIIVILVVVLEGIFFAMLLFFRGTDKKDEQDAATKGVIQDAAFFRAYTVELRDLSYSVMTTSQMATLSMNMDIILGLTEEERLSKDVELPEAVEMQTFQNAVRALEPDIKDELQRIIDNKTIQQLLQPDGKQSIKNDIKNYINDRLRRLKFEAGYEKSKFGTDLVTDVKITQFILQR